MDTVISRDSTAVRSLLDAGASIELRDKDEKTALDLARFYKAGSIIEMLEEAEDKVRRDQVETFRGQQG